MMNAASPARIKACSLNDLARDAGVAVKLADRQIALFFLPDENPSVYAIDNFDPFGEANVLARGIVGDQSGELVVASPIYKQHFSLLSGQCLEDESMTVKTYPVSVEDNAVFVWV